jgi:polar amino acid transport system permease protein
MVNLLDFLEIALPEYWQGMWVTLQIAAVGLSLGAMIGLPVAVLRVYGKGFWRGLATTYTEVFRGVPLLVLLFVVYYGLPDFKITLPAMTAAFIALGLNSGAYQAEYFRGALQAISEGQMIAARSIGMGKMKAIFYVILPQALRLVLPSWSNEAISIVKYTAVVFVIAVPDLMTRAKLLSSKYYNPIEAYLTVSIFYLAIVGLMTLVMSAVEKKLRIPGMELEKEHP